MNNDERHLRPTESRTNQIYVELKYVYLCLFIQVVGFSLYVSWINEDLPVGNRQIPGLWSSWQAFSSSCEVVWTQGSFPPAQTWGHSLASVSTGQQTHTHTKTR